MRIEDPVFIPDEELNFRFSRSGGPGGQNVNTRDTRVEAVFNLPGSASLTHSQKNRAMQNLRGRLDQQGRLRVVASEARTQGQNRELAAARLRSMVAAALRPPPPPRRPTRPSASAESRRIARKKARGNLKRLRSSIPDD